jgi:hypothetical protein
MNEQLQMIAESVLKNAFETIEKLGFRVACKSEFVDLLEAKKLFLISKERAERGDY